MVTRTSIEQANRRDDRQQLELKFEDADLVESPTGGNFLSFSPVSPAFGHQSIAGSVVSC
jgi:hypothetical protein